ncbi:alpha/beta hydrolase [Aeoliella sp.]|uniref:alpha/beta hydrolase n=1 Tax=Aeoliella sp. TaxID=2795800 RepID=UPI003CCBCCF1
MSSREMLVFLAAVLCCLVASTTSAKDNSPRQHLDLLYRPDAATPYEQEQCRLDLYLPKTGDSFATLLWVHGGGIQADSSPPNGKRDDIAMRVVSTFVRQGYAVASVEYRMSPRVHYPEYVDDIAAALAYVHQHIAEHGGDPDRLFLAGHSAGGYLVAMVAVDRPRLKQLGVDADCIAGCMPISGQMITHSTVRGEEGTPRTRPVVDARSPLGNVDQRLPAFLCIVGNRDLPLRSLENEYFVAAVKNTGHRDATFLEVKDRDHSTIASRIDQEGDQVAAAMQEFMSRRMKELSDAGDR